MVSNSSFRFKLALAWVGVSALVGLTGCKDLDELKREWARVVSFVTTGKAPRPGATSGSDGPSGGESEELLSEGALQAKAHAELLQEMYRVVLIRDPDQHRAEFGAWLNTLNQGASLEGVYRGLTRSQQYRDLEIQKKDAAAGALKLFGYELAQLSLELDQPSTFTEEDTKPLLYIDYHSPESGRESQEVVFSKGSSRGIKPFPDSSASPSPKPSVDELAQQYSKTFLLASIYTLKRILSDEALKVIDAKRKVSRERVADWYSKWAARVAERKVDFGLEQRNRADAKFHYDWATQASPQAGTPSTGTSTGTSGVMPAVIDDRLIWEVLNRIHRLLNDANQLK